MRLLFIFKKQKKKLENSDWVIKLLLMTMINNSIKV